MDTRRLPLEHDVAVALRHRSDVVRHPLNRRARDEIPGADLPRDGAGAADPNRNVGGLQGRKEIFQRRQIHADDMVCRAFSPQGHRLIPEPEHDIMSLFLRALGCHERQRRRRRIVGASTA